MALERSSGLADRSVPPALARLDLAPLCCNCLLQSDTRRETYDCIATELCDYGLSWQGGPEPQRDASARRPAFERDARAVSRPALSRPGDLALGIAERGLDLPNGCDWISHAETGLARFAAINLFGGRVLSPPDEPAARLLSRDWPERLQSFILAYLFRRLQGIRLRARNAQGRAEQLPAQQEHRALLQHAAFRILLISSRQEVPHEQIS